ncbi:MAG: hypothetical protein FJ194_13235 [Gammaproteobacteria bacterium]|nr:hypothetical protein [Gammaproteobacteria bacterium]
MQSRSATTALPSDHLRLLPWALVLLLLVAQLSASAHKATLDGHDTGHICHACMLMDRDDAPPPEPVSATAPLQSTHASDALPTDHRIANSYHRTPPSRASPVAHA